MPSTTQGSRRLLPLVTFILAACGGGYAGGPAPASPEAAVRAFLNAVNAKSLSTMSETWGSARGPAASYMDKAELEQRLTVIRAYLEHDTFEILEPQGDQPLTQGRRTVRVRLMRKGCAPVVPFTVVAYGHGWLVSDIDLSAAGNPQRPCP
jgi:hypothetical protein